MFRVTILRISVEVLTGFAYEKPIALEASRLTKIIGFSYAKPIEVAK